METSSRSMMRKLISREKRLRVVESGPLSLHIVVATRRINAPKHAQQGVERALQSDRVEAQHELLTRRDLRGTLKETPQEKLKLWVGVAIIIHRADMTFSLTLEDAVQRKSHEEKNSHPSDVSGV